MTVIKERVESEQKVSSDIDKNLSDMKQKLTSQNTDLVNMIYDLKISSAELHLLNTTIRNTNNDIDIIDDRLNILELALR